MCLCAFSIITIAASTIAPIAIAMPPRLMMFEPRPSERMAMKANRMPSGSVMIATSALRTWSRKITHTAATIRLSSSSVHLQVADRALDQFGAVVDRHDLGARRQARA